MNEGRAGLPLGSWRNAEERPVQRIPVLRLNGDRERYRFTRRGDKL